MPKPNAHELRELALDEVSFVDRGGNQHAHIVLTKSECDKMNSSEDRAGLFKQLAEFFNFKVSKEDGNTVIKLEDSNVPQVDENVQKTLDRQAALIKSMQAKDSARDALATALKTILGADTADAMHAAVATFKSAIAGLKKDADIDAADPIAKQMDSMADVDVAEAVKARTVELEKGELQEAEKAFRDKLPESMRAGYDKMSPEERKAMMSRFGKAADSEDDTVAKSMSTLLETTKTQAAEIEALKQADLERTTKAEFADLKGHVNLDEFVKNVIKLRKVDPEAANAMIETTKKMAGQIETGALFKSIGGSGDGDAGEAEEKLTKMAKALQEKSGGDMSFQQAFAKVLNDNPELYSQSLQESGASVQ